MPLARRPLLAAVAVAIGAGFAVGAIAQPAKLKVAAIYTVPVEQQFNTLKAVWTHSPTWQGRSRPS